MCVCVCDLCRFLDEVTDLPRARPDSNSQPVDSDACVFAAGLSERLRNHCNRKGCAG